MIAHLDAERTLREPGPPVGAPRLARPSQRWRHRLRQLKTTSPHWATPSRTNSSAQRSTPDAHEQAAAAITAQQS